MNVVNDMLRQVHSQFVADTSGSVADYIPELAAVDPDSFGIVVATADGYVYEVGDTATEFTIQSVSKPFTYALALADNGEDAVGAKIDVEPSGEPFNEISLDPVTERPRNPMINAGAITSVSLVHGRSHEDRFDRIRDTYSRYAGRNLTMNEQVYRSEARTGHRNRAIGHMLRSFDIVDTDPDDVVDLYFRQCSIDVTCRDLGVMAATMANNGVNPITRTRVAAPALVERVLSVMTTCGMYDGAGDWVARVGLPAKSGVGGSILAVLPGQLGIAVYSPRLDPHGNSVRGVLACRELSRRLELHFLHVGRAARSAVRADYTLADAPSRRRRSASEQTTLEEKAPRARILELHGDMLFSAAESVVRALGTSGPDLDAVILDMRRVDDVSDVARTMLDDMMASLRSDGCATALVDPNGSLGHTTSSISGGQGERVFTTVDAASQWAEELVLDRWCTGPRQPARVTLGTHPVLEAIDVDHRDVVRNAFELRHHGRGDVIAAPGDDAIGLALILEGRVVIGAPDPAGRTVAVSTLGPGMSFGEMPMMQRSQFLVEVRAAAPVTLALMTMDRFDALTKQDPSAKLDLLETLLTSAYTQAESIIRSLRRPV
jgi:glutaminase